MKKYMYFTLKMVAVATCIVVVLFILYIGLMAAFEGPIVAGWNGKIADDGTTLQEAALDQLGIFRPVFQDAHEYHRSIQEWNTDRYEYYYYVVWLPSVFESAEVVAIVKIDKIDQTSSTTILIGESRAMPGEIGKLRLND